MPSIQIFLVFLAASSAVAYRKGHGRCPSPSPEASFGSDVVSVMLQLRSIGPMYLMFRNGFDVEKTTTCVALKFDNATLNTYDYSAYYGTEKKEINGGEVIPLPDTLNPLNVKVHLMDLPGSAFNIYHKDNGVAGLHFFYQDDLMVMARSCRQNDPRHYLESYYVFVKTNYAAFDSINPDCIKAEAQKIVSHEFYETGNCGNSP